MIIRDYAKSNTTNRPAARPKSHINSSNRRKNVVLNQVSSPPRLEKIKHFISSKIKKLTQIPSKYMKNTKIKLKQQVKKKPNRKKNTRFTNRSHLSPQLKYRLTSVSVFIILGAITAILVLLLFYVMSHKKTTEIKQITLPKPASFLNQPSIDPKKPADVITIPINNTSSNNKSKQSDTKPSNKLNTTSAQRETKPINSSSGENQTTNAPKFTFYDTLKKPTVKIETKTESQQAPQYIYALRVATYKNADDANSMRAKLLLMGFKPSIINDGDYYTVSIDNIPSKRQGDIIRHKLEANDIQGSLLVITGQQNSPSN